MGPWIYGSYKGPHVGELGLQGRFSASGDDKTRRGGGVGERRTFFVAATGRPRRRRPVKLSNFHRGRRRGKRASMNGLPLSLSLKGHTLLPLLLVVVL